MAQTVVKNIAPTKDNYQGAARLRVKTPEEIASERNTRTITAESKL